MTDTYSNHDNRGHAGFLLRGRMTAIGHADG
jgi:hypothetical protein